MSVEDEIEALVRRVVRDEVARAPAGETSAPWLTVEQTAGELVGTRPAAIHTRLARGWLADARVREGKRVLINRAALLAELERKRRRR